LRGVRSEALASCWGLLWAADLARRYYGIEFFTRESEMVMAGAWSFFKGEPAEYREMCG
jgi:hypothetical protein